MSNDLPGDRKAQPHAPESVVTSIYKAFAHDEDLVDRPPAEALLPESKKSPETTVVADLKALVRYLRKSPLAGRIFLLLTLLIGVLVLNVIGEIRMNTWRGAFYRAIEHKNLGEIGRQAFFFVCIVAVLLSFVITQNWFIERIKIRLREALTNNLMDEWMKPARAYRLNMTSEERLNPDHRIHEDVKHFSETSADLGLGAARSTLLLISFVGVLWSMSSGIVLPIAGHSLAIPGYMVWFAIFYAAIGAWLTLKVGRPLITMNEDRYTKEANFRYSLVRISDCAESIAFYSGEKDERKIADSALSRVLRVMKKLSFAHARLTWITCGHGWMVVILPVLVALPGYLQGKLDFGGLMMVVGAFDQVQQSLRWFVENFARIADWRAALHRVVVFSESISSVDEKLEQAESIARKIHPEGRLAFEKTKVSLIDGEVVIARATAEIEPGERVLLVGESGSGKSTLFRAVAGLWPWGSGTILHPEEKDMMFLPQKPYMPLGTLATALAYPNGAETWDRALLARALARVNLESFIPMLDDNARWDKLMSLGQQQRLAFARLLLHRPKWIFLDEATSALDDENQALMMSIFTEELKGSSVLSIGHRAGLEQFHTRTLHLNQTRKGRILGRKKRSWKPAAKATVPFKLPLAAQETVSAL